MWWLVNTFNKNNSGKLKAVLCDASKCTGCQICELVCSATKEKKINPHLSRIHVVRIDPLITIALTCQNCEEAPCVSSCPKDAISFSEKGIVKVKQEKCIFCGWCIQSCPFGAITIHSSQMKLCDLCDGEPKCVEHCPKDALTLSTKEEGAQRNRLKSARDLLV